MKALIGPAILAAALTANSAPTRAAPITALAATRSDATQPATDVSARRRHHRAGRVHHATRGPHYRYYIYAPRAYDYYARPHWYRPDPVAPFFPFDFGFGLGPSW